MYLTFEQIRSVAFGALSVRQEADGIHFYKFTPRQFDAFRKADEGLYRRSMTTAGVRLDFHTDSRRLALSLSGGDKFEVYLNDVLYRKLSFESLRKEGKRAEMELVSPTGQPGSVRVTLIFPSHSIGVLEYLELDDGAALTAHPYDCRMLFIGDSITQGWDSEYDSFSWAWRVTRMFHADSLIQGVGGAYYHEDVFDRLDYDPDVVFVALGTNDFGHYKTPDELRRHVSAHLDLIAQEYGKKELYILSPLWRDSPDKAIGSFAQVRETIIEEIARRGLCHIDGFSLMPHMPQFLVDEVHPHDLSFSLIAENLAAQLLRLRAKNISRD